MVVDDLGWFRCSHSGPGGLVSKEMEEGINNYLMVDTHTLLAGLSRSVGVGVGASSTEQVRPGTRTKQGTLSARVGRGGGGGRSIIVRWRRWSR